MFQRRSLMIANALLFGMITSISLPLMVLAPSPLTISFFIVSLTCFIGALALMSWTTPSNIIRPNTLQVASTPVVVERPVVIERPVFVPQRPVVIERPVFIPQRPVVIQRPVPVSQRPVVIERPVFSSQRPIVTGPLHERNRLFGNTRGAIETPTEHRRQHGHR